MALVARALVFEITQAAFTLQYYTIASITILYYDHLITFPSEVRCIWRRRLTLSSVLFLLNRYITFFGYFPIMYFIFSPPGDITLCRHFVRFHGSLSLFTQVIIAIVLTLRAYALYNRNIWIIVFAAFLGVATVITSALSLTQFFGILLNFGLDGDSGEVYRTCFPSFFLSTIPFKTTFLLSLMLDCLIFGLTVTRTYQIMREHRRSGVHSPLPRLLLRDGSMYFAVMAIANLINFALFVDKNLPTTFFAQSAGNNSTLSHIISVTMMSRLILNLHAFDNRRHIAAAAPPHPRASMGSTAGTDSSDSGAGTDATQFTTHISRYTTWIARAAEDFGADHTLDSTIVGGVSTTDSTRWTVAHCRMKCTNCNSSTSRTIWKAMSVFLKGTLECCLLTRDDISFDRRRVERNLFRYFLGQ